MAIRVAILTISDRSFRGERVDASGPVLVQAVEAMNWIVTAATIVPDEMNQIMTALINWVDNGAVDLILTTGGTGFAPRDITPEATLAVIERQAYGLAEAMRANSLKITTHAMLSRAIAGIRKKTLIVNLPGSPKAAVENFNSISTVLPHAIDLLLDSPSAEKGHLSQ